VERVCERCAGEDDDLALVRSRAEEADGAQLWCFACRSSADHDVLDEPG